LAVGNCVPLDFSISNPQLIIQKVRSMSLSLSSDNIFAYLDERKIVPLDSAQEWKIDRSGGKNFNLIIRNLAGEGIFLKQERFNPHGDTLGELLNESAICQLLEKLAAAEGISNYFCPSIIDRDPERSVIVSQFLKDYQNLELLYAGDRNKWSLAIPTAIGKVIATIHQLTWERTDYRDLLIQELGDELLTSFVKIERLTPEIFAHTPADGIKFYTMYQRYESLEKAIDDLISRSRSSCLIHGDFKLNNILLDPATSIVRPIDWERGTWGDPALDLGSLIASYLLLWLNSLVVQRTMSIEETLQLAVVPLDAIRPSISAVIRGYIHQFPEIIELDLDFATKTIQFAGVSLIIQVLANIQYQKVFTNSGIATLQVAKSLLCRPVESMSIVCDRSAFGN
jgi:Phosphotransferase enzyme family